MDLVQNLSVKYSEEYKVTGTHAVDNTVATLAEKHFPRRIPPTEREPKPKKLCYM
jgi:hypothetical protein